MEIFEMILLMLTMVLISNILNRFLPNISIPLIQIFLGVCSALLLGEHFLELSPDLFLLLFIAPLLFYDASNVDKKALWQNKKSILSLSIGLVFATVFILGYFINWLFPEVPLAGAFALAASLAPTDAVAVSAIAQRVKLPHKILHILEGESLINDASGLVSFQFAALALVTGTFSLANASISFVVISLGGIILGTAVGFLKLFLTNILRKFGIENLTSFMLFELLLPFIAFLIAEHLGVNGILSAVSAGIVHSVSYTRINPEIARLNVLSKNTWSVLTFSLNGLAFVLLGTQIPRITNVIIKNNNLNIAELCGYILIITFVLLLLRFVWIFIFKDFKESLSMPFKDKFKRTILYTLSGVRGTITLVSTLSLPILLGNNEAFLQRDLLIFLGAGVIIVTLILANFALPLFAPSKENPTKNENSMEINILRDVILELKDYRNPENEKALSRVILIYNNRIISLTNTKELMINGKSLRQLILKWELENTENLVDENQISSRMATPIIRHLNKKLYKITRDKKYKKNFFYGKFLPRRIRLIFSLIFCFDRFKEQRITLQESNNAYIVDKLKSLNETSFPKEILDSFILLYRNMDRRDKNYMPIEKLEEWINLASQIERETIQRYFEDDKITRSELRDYRNNILAIENTIELLN